LPLLKEIVEILFSKGLVKVMFCTETFAVGINMPTKTAVFLDFHKYDNTKDGLRCLYTEEYLQMAGRAGRRGLDKVGTVVYLPQRKPAYPEEVRAMMKGSTRSIQSRMDFHYDFLLKTLQSGELKWLNILKDSYWFKQRMDVKASLEKELRTLEEEFAKVQNGLSQVELADFAERVLLESKLATSVNAAKKEAQRGLDSWKNKHMGPRWHDGWPKFQQCERMKKTIADKAKAVLDCDNVECLIEPRLQFLREGGFLKADADLMCLNSDSLTLKGILATEVNESHSLLTARLFAEGLFNNASCIVILTVLSSFINEKLDGDCPQLHELQVDRQVKDLLTDVDILAQDFSNLERRLGIPYDNYWTLSLSWVEPVWRWLNDENSANICADYGLYEGNLLRTVLRIANVADEWISLATYCENTEMVGKMTEVKGRLLREIAVTDSLYLRI
jgi:superfamily II RNA helicase